MRKRKNLRQKKGQRGKQGKKGINSERKRNKEWKWSEENKSAKGKSVEERQKRRKEIPRQIRYREKREDGRENSVTRRNIWSERPCSMD
jgi:hypothetical protein